MRYYIMIVALVLFSCQENFNSDDINGEWYCSEWIVESTKENKCNDNVYFNFKKNMTYTSKLGSLKEEGTYGIMRIKG